MTDWRHTTTERLWLDQPSDADVDDLHAIHADPHGWTHFPQGRHQDRARTAEMIEVGERQFGDHGLGYWSVRDGPGGPVVGCAGCAVADDLPWWNLYYRFDTSVRGRGYAVEAARQAMAAAADVEPDRPVLAYLLEHNVASRRTAERLGLRLVWRGPDVGNEDAAAIRLVYVDRVPDAGLDAALAEHGMSASSEQLRPPASGSRSTVGWCISHLPRRQNVACAPLDGRVAGDARAAGAPATFPGSGMWLMHCDTTGPGPYGDRNCPPNG